MTEVLQNISKITSLKQNAKGIISKISDTIRIIDPDHSLLTECNYIQEGFDQEEMVISVVGEFSRGKSCFLNSLLGEKILKEADQPTTATITKIKYGDKPKMIVKFKNGEEKSFPNDNDPDIEPSDFPRYFRDYTSELSKEFDSIGKVSELIKEVICEYPNPILKNGITIVDTPGVSGLIPGHTEMTHEQIRKSNAAICLFSCDMVGGSQGEVDFLKFVKNEMGENPDKLLYLANKMFKAEYAVARDQSEGRNFIEQKNHYIELFKDTIQKHIGINTDDINIFGYDSEWSFSKEEEMKKKGGYYDVTHFIDQTLTSDKQIIESHLKDPLLRTQKLQSEAKSIIEKRLEQINNPQDLDSLNKNLEEFKEREEALKIQMESKVNNLKANLKQIESNLDKRFKEEIVIEISEFKQERLNNIISSIKDRISCEKALSEIKNFEENIKDVVDDFLNNSFKKELENKLKEYGNSIYEDFSDIAYFNKDEIDNLINQINDELKIENQLDLDKFNEYEKVISSFEDSINEVDQEINKLEIDKNFKAKAEHITQKEIDELKEKRRILEFQIQNNVRPEPNKIKNPTVKTVIDKQGWLFTYRKDIIVEEITLDDSNVVRHDNHIEKLNGQIEKISEQIKGLNSSSGNIQEVQSNIIKNEKEKQRIEQKIQKAKVESDNHWSSSKQRLTSETIFRLGKVSKRLNSLKTNVIDNVISKISKDISKITNEKIQAKLDDVTREIERLKQDKQKGETELQQNKNQIDSALASLEATNKDIKTLESEINTLLNNR